ncbi:hypothetical protein [Jatrophihabitans sp.]|uniref:hypothetical protein n=1 Tax=Jatrophihabitans sp. TaxID=1932789 RepID=UPI002BFB5254|nr:hypothetical protein [Jatrophihabitans sp.]
MPATVAGRPGWAFAGPAQRRLAVTAAVLALLATVITVNAARAHPERRVRTIVLPAPPAAVSVDASGCPVRADCRVAQRAIGLDDAFTRAFPSGEVLSVQATLDLRTSSSYRKSLVGLIEDGSTVSLVSQCVPGAPRPPGRLDRSSTAFTDLAGNSVIAYRQLSVLVPGLPGCGVALLLRTRGAAIRFEQAALRLARDPAVQLPLP